MTNTDKTAANLKAAIAPDRDMDLAGVPMSFTEAIGDAIAKTFVLNGRATRSQYWWVYLAGMLPVSLFNSIEPLAEQDELPTSAQNILAILSAIASVVFPLQLDFNISSILIAALFFHLAAAGIALSTMALTIRRLHDLNLSGWLILILPASWVSLVMTAAATPVFAGLVMALIGLSFIVVLALPGNDRPNKYGPG